MEQEKKIKFENHFNLRVVEIHFLQDYSINHQEDLLLLKNKWRENLKFWHSPYTCLLNVTNLKISENMLPEFESLLKFFKNFFMKKTVGYKFNAEETVPNFSFEIYSTYEEAREAVGLNRVPKKNTESNLRDLIKIENDFNEHVMEISFDAPVTFKTTEDIEILKSKLKNMLRLWHTPYSILIHCIQCSFATETHAEFLKLEKFLGSFFCKMIIGYSPCEKKEMYPFKTYRARHLAVQKLTHSGLSSGAVANCSTRK